MTWSRAIDRHTRTVETDTGERPESATTLSRLDVPNLQRLVIRSTHDLLVINLTQPNTHILSILFNVLEYFKRST